MDSDDLDELYRGNQQGRHRNAYYMQTLSHDSDDENEKSDDEDYDPLIDLDVAEDVEEEYNDPMYDEELEHELVDILETSEEEESETFP